jgi:hypothetical protein
MEIDSFKPVWQSRSLDEPAHASLSAPSRSVRFLRTSTIHDLQRSYDLSRIFMNLLFILLLIGAAIKVMITGTSRVAAFLFAAALLADGIPSLVLLSRRFRESTTATILECIARECRQLEVRLRLERYCRVIMVALGIVMLAILALGPGPATARDQALDTLARMALATGFLAVAWRGTKSRTMETRRELDRYRKELQS